VKERPILFSTEMVKAILEGRKTQTRRVIKPQPTMHDFGDHKCLAWGKPLVVPGYLFIGVDRAMESPSYLRCPYGSEGTVLWVRETWAQENVNHKDVFIYKADGWDRSGLKWKSSIHMPRKAARIFLKVKNVRVERLQDISEEDAKAEGVDHCCPSYRHKDWNDKWISGNCHDCTHHNPITGKRETCGWRHDEETRFQWSCGCGSSFELRDDKIPEPYRFKFAFVWDELLKLPFWNDNPWVWIVEFERTQP